ncbi:hypothetical protein QBC39DRAFT_350328 [Podospora conica]|nr:hypothetical protein QBC39DRAFT_350328 [Schizothecium conicum]
MESVHKKEKPGGINLPESLAASQSVDARMISARARLCQSLFKDCQRYRVLSGGDFIDKMSATFNWWSLGISAERIGRSSLDYRVRARDDVRDLFISLLDSLVMSLQNCVAYAQVTPENAQSGLSPRLPDENSKLGEQFYYIKSSVDSLGKISAAIRKAGTKFRHERVDKLRAGREADLAEFRAFLRSLILVGPIQMHLYNRMPRDTTTQKRTSGKVWKFLTSERRLSPVQERLIKANLTRRNRFDIYYDEYCRKMAKAGSQTVQQDRAAAATAATEEATGKGSKPRPAPSQLHSVDHLPEKKTQEQYVDSHVQSSRKATDLAPSFIPPKISRRLDSEAKSVVTRGTQIALKQNYPKCPAGEGSSFWCPFCAQLLDATYSGKKDGRWRGHVAEDLSPYICVYVDCPVAEALYTTSQDWKQHLKDFHSTTRWICDACWLGSASPAQFEFKDEQGWNEHVTTTHQGEFNPGDLQNLAEMSCRTVLPPVECPLCFAGASLQEPETDTHIAEHLHDFALQALPWEGSNASEDDTNKIASVEQDTGLGVSTTENSWDISEDIDWDEPCHLPTLIATAMRRCTETSAKTSSLAMFTVLHDLNKALHALKNELEQPNFTLEIGAEIGTCLGQLESLVLQSGNEADDMADADELVVDIAQRLESLNMLRPVAESMELPPPTDVKPLVPEIQAINPVGGVVNEDWETVPSHSNEELKVAADQSSIKTNYSFSSEDNFRNMIPVSDIVPLWREGNGLKAITTENISNLQSMAPADPIERFLFTDGPHERFYRLAFRGDSGTIGLARTGKGEDVKR